MIQNLALAIIPRLKFSLRERECSLDSRENKLDYNVLLLVDFRSRSVLSVCQLKSIRSPRCLGETPIPLRHGTRSGIKVGGSMTNASNGRWRCDQMKGEEFQLTRQLTFHWFFWKAIDVIQLARWQLSLDRLIQKYRSIISSVSPKRI